jgi:hypothetical protein
MTRKQRFRAVIAIFVATAGLFAVGSVQGAGAATHPTYPLAKAKSCRVNYHKRVLEKIVTVRVKVHGKWKIEHRREQYVACVYEAPVRIVVTTTTIPTTTTTPVTPALSVQVIADGILGKDSTSCGSWGPGLYGDPCYEVVASLSSNGFFATGNTAIKITTPDAGACENLESTSTTPTGYCYIEVFEGTQLSVEFTFSNGKTISTIFSVPLVDDAIGTVIETN